MAQRPVHPCQPWKTHHICRSCLYFYRSIKRAKINKLRQAAQRCTDARLTNEVKLAKRLGRWPHPQVLQEELTHMASLRRMKSAVDNRMDGPPTQE